MKSYLSVRQCVARLNGAVSIKLIYALVKKGRLRANRALGKLLVEEDSLLELLNEEPTLPPPAEEVPVQVPARQRKGQIDLW